MSLKIFIVEDNDWYNQLLVHCAEMVPDVSVKSFKTGREALQSLNMEPDLITIDYRLPDILGDELLLKIKEQAPHAAVIVISEQEDIETAVDMLKNGAFDYLVKNDEIKQRLINAISRVEKTVQLQNKVNTLQSEVEQKYNFGESIKGNSPSLMAAFQLMQKAAATTINVYLKGETGTGKEVAAKAIHYNSLRCKKAFVPVNISAFSKELLESELFGHEKGAFTGAHEKRAGRFAEASGGTLFLDEIAELDIQSQTKLLRVLQEREYNPVGSNKTIKTDFRLIVATHKDLTVEVKEGRFREDLFYRIMGLTIELPPLRERGHDILVLANTFIKEFAKENKMEAKEIDEAACQKLLNHAFPGNVRELKSVIETALVLSSDNTIQEKDIIFQIGTLDAVSSSTQMTLRDYTYRLISNMLVLKNNSIPQVAKALDISQATIYRILKEYK